MKLFLITFFKIVPIFVIIFIGYIFGKIYKKFDIKMFSKLSLYIFGSILSFTYINQHPPKGADFLLMIKAYAITFGILYLLIYVLNKLGIYKYDKGFTMLNLMYINAGYLGYPIITALYGSEYISYAVIFVITMTLFSQTIGIVLLTGNIKEGLVNMIKLPMIYAFLLGWILGTLGIKYINFPDILRTPIVMLKDSAIPFILIFIGMSLSRIKIKSKDRILEPLLVSLIKMFLVPIIGIFTVKITNMNGMLGTIFIIECAMPSAMNVVMIAHEIGKKPDEVSLVIFFTSVLSLVSIPIISLMI